MSIFLQAQGSRVRTRQNKLELWIKSPMYYTLPALMSIKHNKKVFLQILQVSIYGCLDNGSIMIMSMK